MAPRGNGTRQYWTAVHSSSTGGGHGWLEHVGLTRVMSRVSVARAAFQGGKLVSGVSAARRSNRSCLARHTAVAITCCSRCRRDSFGPRQEKAKARLHRHLLPVTLPMSMMTPTTAMNCPMPVHTVISRCRLTRISAELSKQELAAQTIQHAGKVGLAPRQRTASFPNRKSIALPRSQSHFPGKVFTLRHRELR